MQTAHIYIMICHPGSPAPPLVTGKLWKIEISEEQITLAGDPILSRNIIFKVHTYSSYLISKWFSERRCYFSTLEYQQSGSPCFAWIYLGQQKIAGDFDGQRTYCAKYDRLAGGDEVFCDQLHYAAVQEEDDDEVPFTFRHPYSFSSSETQRFRYQPKLKVIIVVYTPRNLSGYNNCRNCQCRTWETPAFTFTFNFHFF